MRWALPWSWALHYLPFPLSTRGLQVLDLHCIADLHCRLGTTTTNNNNTKQICKKYPQTVHQPFLCISQLSLVLCYSGRKQAKQACTENKLSLCDEYVAVSSILLFGQKVRSMDWTLILGVHRPLWRPLYMAPKPREVKNASTFCDSVMEYNTKPLHISRWLYI